MLVTHDVTSPVRAKTRMSWSVSVMTSPGIPDSNNGLGDKHVLWSALSCTKPAIYNNYIIFIMVLWARSFGQVVCLKCLYQVNCYGVCLSVCMSVSNYYSHLPVWIPSPHLCIYTPSCNSTRSYFSYSPNRHPTHPLIFFIILKVKDSVRRPLITSHYTILWREKRQCLLLMSSHISPYEVILVSGLSRALFINTLLVSVSTCNDTDSCNNNNNNMIWS